MCGIIGIWSKNNKGQQQLDRIANAVKLLNHRGPDHSDYKIYSNCALGHTRLSIIDTDGRSNQPFLSDDGRYALVFNGEIYNYSALKNELIAKGITFRTDSDTEVLMHYLIEEGEEALQRLDGFFAFAFYDLEKDQLILARDRMGIKPLVVYEDEDLLLFGSELTPFSAFEIDKTIDLESLNLYFSLTYIPAPKTIFTKARKVMPGNYIKIRAEKIETTLYYHPEKKNSNLCFEDAKEAVKTELKKSVEDRLLADVPLGSFLSGGLDSSIIAALAIQNKPQLKTFSIGFDHPFFDESNYANELSQHIGSEHNEYMLTRADFKDNLDAFLSVIDEPFADSSAFAMYLLSEKTRGHVTVALSGDGADELAGGYRKHLAEMRLRETGNAKRFAIKFASYLGGAFPVSRSTKWGDINRKLQKLVKGFKMNAADRYWNWCQFIPGSERKNLLKSNYLTLKNPLEKEDFEPLDSIFKADQSLVLPNDMLKKVDLMSMAHGLEVRTPFLAHKFVELMNSLPVDYKIRKDGGKYILREAFAELLPPSIITRAKKGFEIPIKEWLNDDIQELLEGPLFEVGFIKSQGLFDLDYIDSLRRNWKSGSFGDRIYVVWALIVFQSWYIRVNPSLKND